MPDIVGASVMISAQWNTKDVRGLETCSRVRGIAEMGEFNRPAGASSDAAIMAPHPSTVRLKDPALRLTHAHLWALSLGGEHVL